MEMEQTLLLSQVDMMATVQLTVSRNTDECMIAMSICRFLVLGVNYVLIFIYRRFYTSASLFSIFFLS